MPSTEPGSHDHRPIHQRIAADLRDQIMSGDLAPGGSIPPTSQLMERFGASNATIQRAVQILKDEGLAQGRAGSGVTVREHRRRLITPANYSAPAAPGQPYRWLSEAAQQGFQPNSILLDVAVTRPPVDIRLALGLGDADTAVLRQQVLMLNGEPAELVQSYYPLDLAQGTAITEKRKIRGGTPRLLADLGYPPRHTVDKVSACVPTRQQFEILQLPSELPVLRTFRVVYSDHDRPIEATVMAKAGHLYELQYAFGT